MNKLLIATTNKHKIKEIAAIFNAAGLEGWELIGLDAFPDYQPPEENGQTFAENAMIKALAAAKMSGLLTLADDSGLAVAALNGEPGVYSARYADLPGKTHNDAANRRKLLEQMHGQFVTHEENGRFCAELLLPAGSAAVTEERPQPPTE